MMGILNFKKKQKGFTLIELLIVIGIIGILSGVLLVNFLGIRQRGRDGVRKSDLSQIQSALELYRADEGKYPATTDFPACGSQLDDGGTPPVVVYMKKIPCDPINADKYVYTYSPSGTDNSTYSLFACLENTNDPQKDGTNNDTYCTGGDINRSYTRENP